MHGFAIGLSLALVVPISLASRGAAGADTIYLVNGRTIHTASAGVQDDRVVFTQFGGDVLFPKVDWSHWNEVSREEIPADERNEYPTTFSVYDRSAT